MKISDLARAAQTQPETIRYYERKGLLPAPRPTTGPTTQPMSSAWPLSGTAGRSA